MENQKKTKISLSKVSLLITFILVASFIGFWYIFYPRLVYKKDFDKYCEKTSESNYDCDALGILGQNEDEKKTVKAHCSSLGFKFYFNSCYNFQEGKNEFEKYCGEKIKERYKGYICGIPDELDYNNFGLVSMKILKHCYYKGLDEYSYSIVGFENYKISDSSYYKKPVKILICYVLEDANKKCSDGNDCSSGYCLTNDINCKGSCVGKCWHSIEEPIDLMSGCNVKEEAYILEKGSIKKTLYCGHW